MSIQSSSIAEMSHRSAALAAMHAELRAFEWSRLTDGQRHILEAFLRIASEEGFASVSMRAIGKRLSVSAPALYAHFPGGRDEIITQSMRYHYSRWAQAVAAALDEIEGAEEFFATFIRTHVLEQLQRVDNDMFDLLIAVDRLAQTLPPAARTEADRLVMRHRALLVGAALDLGYSQNVDRAAAMATSMLDGVRSWSGWDGDPEKLEDIAAVALTATSSIFEAMCVRPLNKC
ncbi:TetR/AcrR family transcriptional regulator [Curtobacterium albidum]|uniref:TetR/AcrR family transcriptional regulator n=1 Tax=Curtobacterium citreum TaxID=2036 RepID=A0A850DRR3_9MICO|nr:TetR/AcrR family transcriptional regulator [Curtobacterium albidum]